MSPLVCLPQAGRYIGFYNNSIFSRFFTAFIASNGAFPPGSCVLMYGKTAEPFEKVAFDNGMILERRHDAKDIAQLIL